MMSRRTSGGGLPSYLITFRAKSLRLRKQFPQHLRDKGLLVPERLCRDSSKHAYSYSKTSETGRLVIEVMNAFKYHWICLKCQIENTQDSAFLDNKIQRMSYMN